MKRVRQIINFIGLALFFDWMVGEDRPKEWLDGTLWIWQKPPTKKGLK
jgi:hypothetical protein